MQAYLDRRDWLGAVQLFVLAVALAALWLGLNFAFPDLWPTGIPTIVTRAIVHLAILGGLWLGLARTDLASGTRVTVWLAIAIPYSLWFALVWRLGLNGFFQPGVVRFPVLPVAIFAPIVIWLVVLTRFRTIASLLDAMPPAWLVGVQLYRIFGGIFLVSWAYGRIPGAFALPAGTGDVLTGLLALPAALLVATGTPGGRAAGIAWNVFGLTDLAIAITMGTLTSPGPLQMLSLDQPNLQTSSFPTVLIPAFAVPSSIVLHGLSLWQLYRLGRREVDARAVAGARTA